VSVVVKEAQPGTYYSVIITKLIFFVGGHGVAGASEIRIVAWGTSAPSQLTVLIFLQVLRAEPEQSTILNQVGVQPASLLFSR